MSYFDAPTVDENSKRSERSELAIRQYFNRGSGFILRMESPDYGCDAMLELMKIPDGATGKKVPAQIKSSADLSFVTVAGKEYLSFSFLTSRLGYLCNHSPAYGLIFIYDDTEQLCYFDFVEAVVNRINEERKSDDWKSQQTINIHIPKENLLTEEKVAAIHQTFTNRFEAHELLLQQFGDKFDIPHFSQQEPAETTAQLTAVELLKKYGDMLLEDYDMLRLFQLLAQVSFYEMTTSKELIFLATVVYSEIGKAIEADFYHNKCNQIINEFTEEEVEILKFTRIKVDFLLGRRSKEEFYKDFKSLQVITQQSVNALQIKINLFYYEIMEQIKANEFDDETENELFHFFRIIDDADLSKRRKHLFKLFHAENVQMYISSRMLKYVNQIRVSEQLGKPRLEVEKSAMLEKTNAQTFNLTKLVLQALNYGKEKNDKFLKAHGHYMLGRFFFTRQFDYMLLNFKDNRHDVFENFRMFFLRSLEAHNLFLSLGLLKDARHALLNAYELSRLAKLWYGIDITNGTPSEEDLLKNIRASESEMGITDPYNSIVDNVYNNLQKTLKSDDGSHFKKLTDAQVDFFADNVLSVYGLPPERRIHIVNEIRAYRFFYLHCDTQNFTLLCDLRPHQNESTKYASATRYILVSNRTGVQSQSSTDVEALAKAFGAINSKDKDK